MKYFIAVYGEKYARKDPVDGSRYPISYKACQSNISVGDTMILYCTASYPGYDREAVGLGEVIKIDHEVNEMVINYTYRPFTNPIGRDMIMGCLTDSEKQRFRNLWISKNWLFEISKDSFKCVTV